jgi:hypothetical protein
MGKATIVSLFPFDINEIKPGVYPGHFHLEPCLDVKKPSILHINDAISYLFDGLTGKSMPINQPVEVMAKSVVDDFRNSFLTIGPDSGPGIFWVEGHHSVADIVKLFSDDIRKAELRQYKWFEALVRLADDDFAKYGQHRAVSDLQRYAADYLHLDRVWKRKLEEQRMTNCPACRSTIPEDALVCASCRTIIRPQEYEAGGFRQVKGAA